MTDALDREGVEQALRESEARFRAFVSASSDVVYRMSPDWSQMRELDGHGFLASTSEPTENWMEHYILPEDRSAVREAIDRAIRTKTLFQLEHRVRRADGTIGLTVSRAAPVLDESGQIIEWLGAASDVTARREAEAREAFLLNLSDVLRSLNDAVQIQGETARLLRARYDSGWCYYVEFDHDHELITVAQESVRDGLPSMAGKYDFTDMPDFLAIWQRGETVSVEDFQSSPLLSQRGMALYGPAGISAFLGVPVLRENALIAALVLADTDPHPWPQSTADVVGDSADRIWAAVERARAEAALRASEEKYRTLFETMDQGFCIVDKIDTPAGQPSDFRYVTANPAFERHTGMRNIEGKSIRELVPDAESRIMDIYDEVVRTGELRHLEDYVQALDLWMEAEVFPTAKPGQIAVLFSNVSERRRAEQRQRMLLAELQHRVRNTLAVVRSIARRTAERSRSVEELSAHFQGRLDAFSRVQAVVTRNPDAGIDLARLIEDELLAHAEREGEALEIAGPDISLTARAAESISLAIHELATNAVKYGALTSERGRIAVRWERTKPAGQELLRLVWEENGVEIKGGPERQGFGLELLQRSLPYDLRAETRVEFRPEGVRFTMAMPLGPDVLAE